MEPVPTAAIADGPRGLTINVSTSPIVIQPSSAWMMGIASRNIGRNSLDIDALDIDTLDIDTEGTEYGVMSRAGSAAGGRHHHLDESGPGHEPGADHGTGRRIVRKNLTRDAVELPLL